MTDVKRCPTCNRRITRSTDANRRYFKLITLLSEKPVRGTLFSKESFHEYCKNRFLGSEELKLPNGKVIMRTLDTHGLSVDEFNEYMGEVEAFCAEHGVWLEE